jgi:hypothetical protein
MMNNIKTVATFVSLIVAMILLITVMTYSFWTVMFPKDETIESNWEYIQYHNAQRAELIETLQKESICNDDIFDHSNCE